MPSLGNPRVHLPAGQLAALAGRYAEAADLFARAAAFYDDPQTGRLPAVPETVTRRLWDETVWWRLGAGQVGRARDLASRVLGQGGASGDSAEFLGKVSAIEGEFD